jgi:hypothetical protein
MHYTKRSQQAALLVVVVLNILSTSCRSSDVPRRESKAIATLAGQTRSFQSAINAARRTEIGANLEPAVVRTSSGARSLVWRCDNGGSETGKAACDKIGTILQDGGCICKSTANGTECDCP